MYLNISGVHKRFHRRSRIHTRNYRKGSQGDLGKMLVNLGNSRIQEKFPWISRVHTSTTKNMHKRSGKMRVCLEIVGLENNFHWKSRINTINYRKRCSEDPGYLWLYLAVQYRRRYLGVLESMRAALDMNTYRKRCSEDTSGCTCILFTYKKIIL